MSDNPPKIEVCEAFSNKYWRLNNLYWIQDKEGNKVPFRCNPLQEQLFDSLWYCNILLKARQFGGTTFVDLYFLDECLFNPYIEAAIIAHNKEDAQKIFRRKIQFPYLHLPEGLRNAVHPTTDSKSELVLSNHSSIYVATSVRSATIQYLHISEHAKICRKYPEKAEEIKTGSLNAVQAGQMIVIESTAEGAHGDFFELCQTARKSQAEGKALSELDFRFHFFPWFANAEYSLDPEGIMISQYYQDYFNGLEKRGITLSDGQKAWYVKKAALMGEKMLQEFPSTPDEAFHTSIEGAYFAKQLDTVYHERRITEIPVDERLEVHTFWDLGIGDNTSIWFMQMPSKQELRLVDYYENSGEGLEHYIRILRRKNYVYGRHVAPHDIEVRELTSGKTRRERASAMGIRFETCPKMPKEDQIESARDVLSQCWFDEGRCDKGIKCLENYRKEWDDKLGRYKDMPLHDWASNGADAFIVMAVSYDKSFRLFQGF